MTPEDLAKMLSEMYAKGSKSREKVTMVQLYGVKYAGEIEQCGVSPATIASMAQIPPSYGIDINSGKKLSKYVRVI